MAILLRDKFRCLKCNNERIVVGNNLILRKLHLLYVPYEADPDIARNENIPSFYAGNFNAKFLYDKLSLAEYVRLTSIEHRSVFIAFTKETNQTEVEYGILTSPTLDVDFGDEISSVHIQKNLGRIEWLYTHGLNVHHKYYQDHLLPWQYPHKALVTFCKFCHDEHHIANEIPILDIHGNLKNSNFIEARFGSG